MLFDGLRASAVEPEDVHTTYLTGGSSRIPRVASILRSVLGGAVVPAPRPKDVVAIGATLDWPRLWVPETVQTAVDLLNRR
jgi:molecular chaperone DnaK (HSP70)